MRIFGRQRHDILSSFKTERLSEQGINNNYQSDIKVFNAWAGGRLVNPELIHEFFEEMRDHRAASTLGRYRAAIKGALLRSFGAGITLAQRAQVHEFFAEIKTGRKDQGIRSERCLNREQLKAIKKASGHKTRLIIQALYETACRVSELVDIRIKDCNAFGDGVLVNIRRGRLGKSRIVFLSRKTFQAIRKAWKGNEYLFEHQGRHLHKGTISTLLKRAGLHIGIHLHPHVLRHTWATLSIGELGLSAVSQYLGHSSPSTTAAYYIHGSASFDDVAKANSRHIGRIS